MNLGTALYVIGLMAVGGAPVYGHFETIGGALDSAAFAGNGSLTVGVGEAGGLTVVRWPGATAPNQISRIGDTSPVGAMWGLPREDGIDWLPGSGSVRVESPEDTAPILRIVYPARDATETVFVLPDTDVAVVHLQFNGQGPPSNVVWYSDFSPCTSTMRGVPSSESFFTARRDMIAYATDDAILHVRPERPGSIAWEAAETWMAGGAEPGWFGKGDGVWAAYATRPQPDGVLCADASGDSTVMALAESGSWGERQKVVGQCASAVRVPIDADTRSATLFIALGRDRKSAMAALGDARALGFEPLLERTRASWDEWLTKAALPNAAPEAVVGLYRTALRNLLLCADTESGAIARAPHSSPPLAVDFPRLGAWTVLALDRAGEVESAGQHVQFLADSVRQSDAPGAPAGTLPAALYVTGEDAAPQLVLDVHTPAWLLWSIWQHDAYVQAGEREEYRKEMWSVVELSGDYVASTCRAVRTTPVFSFDPATLSDRASLETIAIACAGLRAANAFALATGNERPEWTNRLLELEDYLRFHALDTAGNFKIPEPLVLWPTEFLGAGDARWTAPVETALERIPESDAPEALTSLANASMLLRDRHDKLTALRPLVEPVVRQALDRYPCDSYYSALAVVAILNVYSA